MEMDGGSSTKGSTTLCERLAHANNPTQGFLGSGSLLQANLTAIIPKHDPLFRVPNPHARSIHIALSGCVRERGTRRSGVLLHVEACI